MIRALVLIAALVPGLAAAQDFTQTTPDDQIPQDEPAKGLADGTGAMLRGLDKVSGIASDINLNVGQSVKYGPIKVTLRECRYPADDPSSDAYAYVTVTEEDKPQPDFSGWMIASSPALSALDHPRYDVWVIRCKSD
ncbi:MULTISPECIES: DUF2155 domain-containing protein [Thioclava]|uniref:DUF2155 domain-containing protein n=1 Tax=Thioclava TaxID=285107 RepID=UPI000C6762D7|nr:MULTISPECIES: DUF2155 domain-containing protein [Thioclava]MAQ37382.1 hypothetical protein [Thioclava sp.]|tara:strand:- start:149 stop:559 length:411 start_codon:yes stop_codon:yes gene_type:complete